MGAPDPMPSLADRLRAFRYHPDEDVSGLPLLPAAGSAPPAVAWVDELREFLSFGLGLGTYAVPLGSVLEILRARRLVEIPRAEPPLLGVLDLRGTVTPVYDLGLALGLRDRLHRVAGPAEECEPVPRESRILVTRTASGPAGLWVDRVRDVVRLGASAIEAVDPGQGAVVGRGRDGAETLWLLDVGRVLG